MRVETHRYKARARRRPAAPKMWHNVGLTLLVFVATLLIVLLLMVCGEWVVNTRRLGSSCRLAGSVSRF